MALENRINRVADRIREEVGYILAKEIRDPRLGFVTVTRVVLSRDLKHAKVLYSTMGSEEDRKKTSQALESARGFIRRKIGETVPLRFTPEILFVFDKSIEEGIKIERILREIEDS